MMHSVLKALAMLAAQILRQAGIIQIARANAQRVQESIEKIVGYTSLSKK